MPPPSITARSRSWLLHNVHADYFTAIIHHRILARSYERYAPGGDDERDPKVRGSAGTEGGGRSDVYKPFCDAKPRAMRRVLLCCAPRNPRQRAEEGKPARAQEPGRGIAGTVSAEPRVANRSRGWGGEGRVGGRGNGGRQGK